jgi:GTP cyclohydrolase I
MQEERRFENAVKEMLEIIGEDISREGLVKTPNRVYKAFKF